MPKPSVRAGWLLGVTCLALVGCVAGTPPAPTVDSSLPPTVVAPAWREPGTPVTAANASQLSYLGRLDTPGTLSTVFAHAIADDGARLAALNNESVITWDLITGEMVFAVSRGDALRVDLSPDKDELYLLDAAGAVRVLNGNTGAVLARFEAMRDFYARSAYDPGNGRLALDDTNGQVRVWDLPTRTALGTFQAQSLRLTVLAFSADGQRLLTAGDDRAATLWDWLTRAPIAQFVDDPPVLTVRAALAPDGSQVALATRQDVRLWSLAPDGRATRGATLSTGADAAADVLAYSPEGRTLVNAGTAANMSVWNTTTGTLAAVLPGVSGDVSQAAFSADGSLLLTTVLGGPVTLWQVGNGQQQTTRAELPAGAAIYNIAWTPDGRALLLFEADGPVQVWGIPASPTQAAAPATPAG